ncbi:N-acetyltransferase family protein [Rhizobium sp. YIM 134829]|uniref:GNAT family N-acetyltransferase n=1 Tax=Rhizobium sp. YIM 134829 TaxID=3390453 RepID=UPI00397B8C02
MPATALSVSPPTADHSAPDARPPVVTIRAARQSDLEALCAMITELAVHHGDVATPTVAALSNDLFSARPWVTALVAEAGGRLIGYAMLTPLYRANETARGMDLHQLYVEPNHRGTGIGRHLVARAREEAVRSGCAYLSVGAATGNVRAHRFYESERFVPRPVTGMRYLARLT